MKMKRQRIASAGGSIQRDHVAHNTGPTLMYFAQNWGKTEVFISLSMNKYTCDRNGRANATGIP